MRRAVTATLGAAAIAVPTANTYAGISAQTAPAVVPKVTVVKKTVAGPAAPAWDFGTVRVTLVVKKTTTVVGTTKKVTRKIVSVGATYAVESPRSQYIMEQTIPVLRQEALKAQSARIDLVSGATATSEAFITSLQAAVLKAKKV